MKYFSGNRHFGKDEIAQPDYREMCFNPIKNMIMCSDLEYEWYDRYLPLSWSSSSSSSLLWLLFMIIIYDYYLWLLFMIIIYYYYLLLLSSL